MATGTVLEYQVQYYPSTVVVETHPLSNEQENEADAFQRSKHISTLLYYIPVRLLVLLT